MGVFWGTTLIIITIIRGGDAVIFVIIYSLLIIVRGVLATGLYELPFR
jgi:hypothetical protein